MEDALYQQICRMLQQYNYQSLPTDSEQVKMYATFNGGCLYLINVINLEGGYAYDQERFAHYKDITTKQFEHVNVSKIILLNLLMTPDTEAIYEAVDYLPDFDDRLIDIQWLIDTTQKRLIIPGQQVKKVIGLEKDIAELLQHGETHSHRVKQVNRDHQKPYLTFGLIGLNILLFLFIEVVGGGSRSENLMQYGAILSTTFFSGHEYYKLFTSMFLHFGWMHLFYNIFGLYIFGTRLEVYMKPWKFLLMYLGAGVTGGMLSVTVDYVTKHPTIAAGASGAVYGVMGALLIYSKIYKRDFEGLSSYTIWLMLILGIAMGMMTPGIGNLAHLGGFIGGAVLAYLLQDRQKN